MNLDYELDTLLESVFFKIGKDGEEDLVSPIIEDLTKELEKVLRSEKKDLFIKDNQITIKGTNLFNRMSSVKLSDSVEGMILRKYYDLKPRVHIKVTYFKVGGKLSLDFKNKKKNDTKVKYRLGTELTFTTSIKIEVKKADRFKLTRIIKHVNNKETSITYEKLSEENITEGLKVLTEGRMKEIWELEKTKKACIVLSQNILDYENNKFLLNNKIKNMIKTNLNSTIDNLNLIIKSNIACEISLKLLNELLKDDYFKDYFESIDSLEIINKNKKNNLINKINLKDPNFFNEYSIKRILDEKESIIKDYKLIIEKLYKDNIINKIEYNESLNFINEILNVNSKIYKDINNKIEHSILKEISKGK